MRRTKEEAALTREAIVEGALACFDTHGIASSTMEQIARAAGVTKGALYHHFDGKAGILRAIRDRVTLPFLDEADTALLSDAGAAPLERVERFLAGYLETVQSDRRTRAALTVMQFRCEYVGELALDLARVSHNVERLSRALAAAYARARARRELRAGLDPEVAAIGTTMFINGLTRLWLLSSPRSGARRHARAAIAAHVEALRRPAPASRRRAP